MDMILLTASARSSGIKTKALRKSGQVPCVLYGNDVENVSFECSYNVLHKTYATAGRSTLVELDTGEKKVPVLFHKIDFDPVSDKIIHVDFYAVDMKKEIEAQVPIRHEGESLAAKELGGILITPHDHVTVKCLPTNLPHDLVVSLENLVEFGSVLTVADIQVPEGVKVEDDGETVIATVQEPRAEEVVEEAPVEGEEEELAEGEEGEAAEGAEGDEKAEGEDGEKKEEGGGDKKEGETDSGKRKTESRK